MKWMEIFWLSSNILLMKLYAFYSKLITKIVTVFIIVVPLQFILIGTGCNSASPQPNKDVKKPLFFDLKGYMNAEIERLNKREAFVKSVRANGTEEEKELTKLNLKNELKPFFDSDINKPAWSDKYEIDSVLNKNNELIKLNYNALDENLRTRLVSVIYEDNEVVLISIKNNSSSSIASINQTLLYDPQKGYILESKQDVSLLDENHFRIEVRFR